MSEMYRENHTNLNGTWHFKLDPAGVGEAESWQLKPEIFDAEITVPGAIQAQNAGFPTRNGPFRTANFHESFDGLDRAFLTTPSECYCDAWYAKRLKLPVLAPKQRLWLVFETIHPYATVWLDGEKIARHTDGPFEPLCIDLTRQAAQKPDETAFLAVRVEEEGRILQGVVKWPYYSGITRDVRLETGSFASIGWVNPAANINDGSVVLSAKINEYEPGGALTLEAQITKFQSTTCLAAAETAAENGCAALTLKIKNHSLWSPAAPNLYTAALTLRSGGEVLHRKTVNFGFREMSREGNKIYLNGERIFLRGTGFTYTMPGVTVENDAGFYRRLVRRAKEYGFNWLRWHTSSMERELIEAADEEGILLQSELFSTFYETETEREMTTRQCELMLLRNRSHPSIFTFALGNEHECRAPQYIKLRDDLCKMIRKMAPGTLVADSDGIQGLVCAPHAETDLVMPGAATSVGNAFDMSGTARDYVKKYEKPVIIHEFGYPESFPNTADIPKYSGPLRPFWLEHAKKAAEESGTAEKLDTYIKNSRALHYKLVKRGIEDLRTVDDLAGYNQWGFFDFVHESTGLVDIFLNDKGGNAEDFRDANGDVAMSIKPDCGRMTGYMGQDFGFSINISNHTAKPIEKTKLIFRMVCDGLPLQLDDSREVEIAASSNLRVDNIRLKTPSCATPRHARVRAYLGDIAFNSWDVWFFPRRPRPDGAGICYLKESWPTYSRISTDLIPGSRGVTEAALTRLSPENLLITTTITDAVADFLERGGKVFLMPAYYTHATTGLPMLPSTFSPAPSFGGGEGGCGTVIEPHLCMNTFPHQGFCDLQFFDLMSGENLPHECVPFHNTSPQVFDLSEWPADLEPIIRSIPNWKVGTPRAYMFESDVGKGRLFASALRLFETAVLNPESDWLLCELINYLGSEHFRPKSGITINSFNALRKSVMFNRL